MIKEKQPSAPTPTLTPDESLGYRLHHFVARNEGVSDLRYLPHRAERVVLHELFPLWMFGVIITLINVGK